MANQDRLRKNLSNHQIGNLYGLALSLVQLGLINDAESIITRFLDEKQEFGHFHILYADLMIEKEMPDKALQHLNKRLLLSPRNIPLTIKYAELELANSNSAYLMVSGIFLGDKSSLLLRC